MTTVLAEWNIRVAAGLVTMTYSQLGTCSVWHPGFCGEGDISRAEHDIRAAERGVHEDHQSTLLLQPHCLVWLTERNNVQGWALAYFTTYGCGIGTPAGLPEQTVVIIASCPHHPPTKPRPPVPCINAAQHEET